MGQRHQQRQRQRQRHQQPQQRQQQTPNRKPTATDSQQQLPILSPAKNERLEKLNQKALDCMQKEVLIPAENTITVALQLALTPLHLCQLIHCAAPLTQAIILSGTVLIPRMIAPGMLPMFNRFSPSESEAFKEKIFNSESPGRATVPSDSSWLSMITAARNHNPVLFECFYTLCLFILAYKIRSIECIIPILIFSYILTMLMFYFLGVETAKQLMIQTFQIQREVMTSYRASKRKEDEILHEEIAQTKTQVDIMTQKLALERGQQRNSEAEACKKREIEKTKKAEKEKIETYCQQLIVEIQNIAIQASDGNSEALFRLRYSAYGGLPEMLLNPRLVQDLKIRDQFYELLQRFGTQHMIPGALQSVFLEIEKKLGFLEDDVTIPGRHFNDTRLNLRDEKLSSILTTLYAPTAPLLEGQNPYCEPAALEIQRIWRGHSARQNYREMQETAREKQADIARFMEQMEAQQALTYTTVNKTNLTYNELQLNAASKIQRIWRGYSARQNYSEMQATAREKQAVTARFMAQMAAQQARYKGLLQLNSSIEPLQIWLQQRINTLTLLKHRIAGHKQLKSRPEIVSADLKIFYIQPAVLEAVTTERKTLCELTKFLRPHNESLASLVCQHFPCLLPLYKPREYATFLRAISTLPSEFEVHFYGTAVMFPQQANDLDVRVIVPNTISSSNCQEIAREIQAAIGGANLTIAKKCQAFMCQLKPFPDSPQIDITFVTEAQYRSYPGNSINIIYTTCTLEGNQVFHPSLMEKLFETPTIMFDATYQNLLRPDNRVWLRKVLFKAEKAGFDCTDFKSTLDDIDHL